MQKITTFLTFESGGKEAVAFYTAIFKDAKINNSMTMPGSDQLLYASFTLNGQDFAAMDAAGMNFAFSQGISLFVSCEDQAEVDYLWEKLGAGGEYLQCGWLKDKFGVSWQIIPVALGKRMQDPDKEKAGKVMQAMLKMTKIDVAGIEAAYNS